MATSLKSRFPMVAAELRPKVSRAVKRAAELVSMEGQARVPIGEPQVHLRDNFHVTRLDAAEYEVSVGGKGPDEPFYAHMVEHGTSHSAPRPFLVPALEARRHEAVMLVREALGDL